MNKRKIEDDNFHKGFTIKQMAKIRRLKTKKRVKRG